MIIKVLFFGKLRELLKTNEQILTITTENYNVQELVKNLKESYPILCEQIFIVSLNKNYVLNYNTLLNNNDELALIPPISGG